ncbi:MAG: ribosome silencing factor [Nitratireductor sp.]|nr:ribosome silencing factor [Nitratireductor sp.]MCB1456126.1 ribosome silencing factor [Nitratireductor sp.]
MRGTVAVADSAVELQTGASKRLHEPAGLSCVSNDHGTRKTLTTVTQARSAAQAAADQATSTVAHSVDGLLETIVASLDDSKAEQPVTIDIKGKSPIADYMVVVSGRSHRHVGAIADHLLRELKDKGYGTARVDGLPACDWVLIDASDVIVHIFRPEVRDFYNIEKMWQVPETAPAPADLN